VRTREKGIKIIENTANKLQLQNKPINYAQAARIKGIRTALEVALDAPQKIHLKKEKRVTIKILNKIETENIRY
jgi:hypothetical protein